MQLIVDFPADRSRSRRSIHFSDTSVMCIVPHHEDNDGVDRHDLWYDKSDYSRMKNDNKEFILGVRAMGPAGIPAVTLEAMARLTA